MGSVLFIRVYDLTEEQLAHTFFPLGDYTKPEVREIAEKNDEISYLILNSTWRFDELRWLDVDCPACLGVNYLLAEDSNLKIQQRYRDSSSTIVGYDLEEENTSRQFLFREN